MTCSTPAGGPVARVAVAIAAAVALLGIVGCTAGQAPTPGPPEFPIVACPVDVAGAPTPPPGFSLIAPGTIVFAWDTWHNMTEVGASCGAQAVRGAMTMIAFSILKGEDRIPWAATLDWPGRPAVPDPVLPVMSLFRIEPTGPVLVLTETGSPSEQYRMMGSYGHDAVPGSYLMRIVSGSGSLLAEGRFEIVE